MLVSRQTISNWENDKFYPDVQSLAIIADIFGTSIDDLVKGDLPMMEMKTEIIAGLTTFMTMAEYMG